MHIQRTGGNGGSGRAGRPRSGFIGFYEVRLDHKWRFSLPYKFRQGLFHNRLFLVLEQKGRAILFPPKVWEEALAGLKPEEKDRFRSLSFELKIEGIGRARLPQSVYEKAGFKSRQVLIITGEGDRLRLWSKALWQRQRRKLPESVLV